MAVSRFEEAQYQIDWAEAKLHIVRGYSTEVLVTLKAQGYEASRSDIYNVIRGGKKDYTILRAIRQVVGLTPPVKAPKNNFGLTSAK